MMNPEETGSTQLPAPASLQLHEDRQKDDGSTSDEEASGSMDQHDGEIQMKHVKEEPADEDYFGAGTSDLVGHVTSMDHMNRGFQMTPLKKEEDHVEDPLYCEECRSFYISKCELHGPALFIPDTPVPMGVVERARRTLPPGLEVRESGIPDAGLGVFNEGGTVPVGAHYGPYQGEVVDREEAMKSCYSWVMAEQHSVDDVLEMISDGDSRDMEQLGEAEDDDEEEWSHAECTEGNADSSEEEDSRDETTIQDTTTKVTKKEHQWEKREFHPPDIGFDECADDDRRDRTPYMYFKHFVTDETLLHVAEQTNSYSVHKEKTSINTTAKEMEQILGMYMHMGLVQMPSVRAYWEMETKYGAVCDVMPRARFQKLLTLIRFRNNGSVNDDAKNDKLWKLRPWLEKLRERFLRVHPEECHAVDVITVPFKGRSHLRVYTPTKPHKWGFKLWARVGQSGFLYDFDVCQGTPDPVAAGDVVLKMTSTLPAGKNHKVFADDSFTSVSLVERLKERGIYYTGTVRMNRIKDCDMMEEKELKTVGRGALDFRVNQDNIVIVRWCDNKSVNLISSFIGIEPLGAVRRWDHKSKTYIMVPRPAIVETFSKFMGGVELFDSLFTLYKFSFRSRRWYMYIWWHTITIAVINAWNLYRRDQNKQKPGHKPMTLRRFQATIAASLTSTGKSKTKCARPLSSPEAGETLPRKRPTSSVPPDVRQDGIDHFPTWQTRQRCKHCTGDRFTHVYCEKCKVHLCLNKHRNCFLTYHQAT